MPDTTSSSDIQGKKVLTQDGSEIGEVKGLDVDTTSWRVPTLEVKLRRDQLESLSIKRPIFGTKTVHLSVDHVSGISDQVILKRKLTELSSLLGDAD